jgi:proteasome-associated ATPase
VSARDDADARARLEKEHQDLTTQLAFLEEEVALLRRKLTDSPRQVRQLEERLTEAQANLSGVVNQNERLVGTLKEAREQIIALK